MPVFVVRETNKAIGSGTPMHKREIIAKPEVRTLETTLNSMRAYCVTVGPVKLRKK